MPNLPISGLPTAGSLTGTELFAIVQGGITKQETLDNIHLYNLDYGVFQTNQTLSGSANVSQSFVIDTLDEASGISIANGLDGRPSKIVFSRTGTFNIQFSAQISQGPAAATVYIWFKQNGTNIPESATAVTVPSNSYLVPAWNFMKTFSANDTCELVWQSTSGNTTFPFVAASGNIPTIPALIVTVSHVR